MQLGCLGFIIGVALTWGGAQGLYTSWAASEQQVVSYANLISSDSSAGWYKVTDASWSLVDAVVLSGTLGVKSDIYIPARPTTGNDPKIHLLVHVVDDELAQQASAMVELPEDQQVERVAASAKLFMTKHPIEGLLEYGIENDSKQTDAVSSALGSDLVSDYKVIELGAKPESSWLSFGMLAIGLLILAAMLLSLVKAGDDGAAEA